MYAKHGRAVRLAYLVAAVVWWVGTGFGRWGRGSVAVLCYHGVTAAQRPRFRWQMSRIARRAIGVDDLSRATAARRGSPRVCVTFDDAFACLLQNALPITCALRIPVTVFAVTGNLGQAPRWSMAAGHPDAAETVMTAAEVRSAVREFGCRFGSHTVIHKPLTFLPAPAAHAEMAESKAALESMLGVPVVDLAFPYGAYDNAAVMDARSLDYARLYTLDPCCYPHVPPLGVVGRFSMSPDASPVEFLLTCAGAYAWLYPWRRLVNRWRAWLRDRLPGTNNAEYGIAHLDKNPDGPMGAGRV